MTRVMRCSGAAVAVLALGVAGGCGTGRSVYTGTDIADTRTPGVSDTDVKMLSDRIIASLLTSSFVERYEKPITISMLKIANKTSDFLDTDALFGEHIMSAIINSGSGTFEFVDRDLLAETVKEAGLAADGLVAAGEATKLGRAAGVRLLMVGELTSIRTADRRSDQRYYKLALRLVDTERNTVVWSQNEEIRKTTKRGWMQ